MSAETLIVGAAVILGLPFLIWLGYKWYKRDRAEFKSGKF